MDIPQSDRSSRQNKTTQRENKGTWKVPWNCETWYRTNCEQTNQLARDVEELAQKRTNFTFLVSEIVTHISQRGENLEHATNAFVNHGKLSSHFFFAFNFSLPCKPRCSTPTIEILDLRLRNGTYLYLALMVHHIDRSVEVLELNPFELISKNSTHTCERNYIGPKYIVYNSSTTSKCRVRATIYKTHTLVELRDNMCNNEKQDWTENKCKEIP